jgi:serine/threonine protein kinase
MTGGSLDKLVHSKKKKQTLHESLKFSRKIGLLLDVVKGLLCLHGSNPVIVHRDLKPGVSYFFNF